MNEAADDPTLAHIREQIDQLDYQIHDLLNERAKLALDVAKIKIAAAIDETKPPVFYRPHREIDVLTRITAHNQGPLTPETVGHIFQTIMSACLQLQIQYYETTRT